MSKLPPEPLFVMRGNDSVHCALFHISASGEYLLIGTEDGMVHTWDLKVNLILKYSLLCLTF